MADEKSIVYNVDIQFGELQKNQEEIKKRISDLREEQSKLDVSTKENQKAFRDNNAQLKALEGQYKLNEKSIGELSNAEKANTDTTNFNNNSIKQNRELLKELNAEYIRLAKPTKEQTDRLKSLTDTLKAQESAIGDNRRNVGNYSDSFKGLIGQFPALQNGLTGVGNGFKALAAGNPFSLILMAVTPLIQSFLKLEPVTNAISGVFEGLSATITTIASSVKNFFDLVSSGGGLFSSFSDAFGGLGSKIGEAAEQGYDLVQALDELEDAERANQASIAQTNRDVAILIAQSKDRTKTEKERIAFLQEANRLEEAQLKKDEQLANRNVAIAADALSKAINNGQDRDKAEQRLADAQQKRFEIQQAAGVQTEKNQGRINGLVEGEVTIREKQKEKEKKILEDRQKEREKFNAKAIKDLEDFTKKVTEQLNAEQKKKLDAFNNDKVINELNRAQIEANLKEEFANGLKTRKQYDDALKQSQIDKNNDEIARLEQYNGITGAYDDQITALKIANQNLVTDNKIANDEEQKQLDEQKLQYELELAQFEATTLQEQSAAEIAILQNKNALILADTTKTEEQKKLEIAKNNAAIVSIEKATGKARIEAINAVGQSFMALSKLLGENTKAGKALAIASTIISTLTSAQNIYESTSKIPFIGSILAPINAGIALLQGYQRVREIRAVEVPQFAEGGLIEGFASGGLSGTRISAGMGMPIRRKNGDNMLATIKTGEVILNQRQQSALGGSNTFKRIGVPGFANGGMVTPDAAIDSSINMAEALRGLQLVVSATEITEVQNRLRVIETTTSL
jgi:hypothetical protein